MKLDEGDHKESTSIPLFVCVPALTNAKPVPRNKLDWKPSISWLKTAMFKKFLPQDPFMPNSTTVDSSGSANRVKGLVFGTISPDAVKAAISDAIGLEFLLRFHEVALKPVEVLP